MKKYRCTFLLAIAFSMPLTGMAGAASVHSAAGVVPPLPSTSKAPREDPATATPSNTGPARLGVPTSKPPLPGRSVAKSSSPNRSATPPATNPPASRPSTPSQAAPTSILADFDTILSQKVTIDVVDMRFEDLLQKLTPGGWRLRTQNIEPATLDQRVDLTAQASRGDVLHELLAQSKLTAKPFEGFDVPLLLITSRSS